MLSLTAEYAVRAMVALCQHGSETHLQAKRVAELTGIPTNYLSKVLHILARSGLVASVRGRNGGFRLERPAREISAFDIVDQFDLISGQRRCFLGNPTCSQETACATHDRWEHVWSVYEQFLRSATLERLASPLAGAPGQSRIKRKTKLPLKKQAF